MITYKNKSYTVVGIIPARGGSKGVPRKNIKLLAGKPLIAFSILEAKKSKYLDRIIVSTEDKEIAEISKRFGAEVVKRPEEMARDTAPVESCLIQAIEQLKEQENYNADLMALLQPTTPFRRVEDIDKALEKLVENNKADSIVSVREAPERANPHWTCRIDEQDFIQPYVGENFFPNRQSLPKVYWRNGQIYAVWAKALLETGSRYGRRGCIPYLMPGDIYHVNIDEDVDFILAETLIKQGIINI